MIIEERVEQKKHVRKSKHGREHEYLRKTTIVVLRCDNCGKKFERARSKMDPKRLNNNYFHVCSNCDTKRFAQKKGVDRKTVWNLHASSNLPIGRI